MPSCPACRSRTRQLSLLLQDRYRLHKCTECATEFLRDTEPGGTEDSAYWMHKEFKLEMYASEEVRRDYERRYASVFEVIHREVGPVSSVLDTGCGIGNFVAWAEAQGMDAAGVDVDAEAVAAGQARGLAVHTPEELDEVVADHSVDAGTLWDVIEHVIEPRDLLLPLLRKVRPGGLVVVETPDASFPLRPVARGLRTLTGNRVRLAGKMYYWEHKVYFTVEGLRRLLAELGCEVVTVTKKTSPRAKMARLFADRADSGQLTDKVLARAWPAMETATRAVGAGNKIVLVARRTQ